MSLPFPTSPPEGGVPRPWRFPDTTQRVLPSGLRVVAVRVPTLPIVHVRWSFPGGKVHEAADRVGVGRLMASLARHGTARWRSDELAETLDSVGARLRVACGRDNTIVGGTGLKDDMGLLLDVIDQVTWEPTFPDAALDRERAKAQEMYRHARADPDTLAAQWLNWSLYGAHPYGRPGTTAGGLAGAVRADLVSLHGRLVRPDGALLLVVGDVDPEEIVDAMEERYRDLKSPGTPSLPQIPMTEARRGGQIICVERAGSEQVSMLVGMPAVARSHPDYLGLQLVNQVLGGGASSRLFLELREKRSLTYGAYSALDVGRLGGDLSASLSCGPDKAKEAIDALLVELGRISTDAIPADELGHSQRYLMGSFPRKASGVGGVAALVNSRWLNDLPEDAWEMYTQRVASLDSDQVSRLAAHWVRPQDATIVGVGPRSALKAAFGHLGEIEWHSMDDREFEGA